MLIELNLLDGSATEKEEERKKRKRSFSILIS